VASEKLCLFSKVELEVVATGPGSLALLTDVPGPLAQRFAFTVPASALRRTVTSRLPYNMQGHLVQAILTPGGSSQITLYRARIWARVLPGGQWEWFPLPVIETPVEFSPAPLPIPPTPEDWKPAMLPIPATPEEWRAVSLEIPPTPEDWKPSMLPILATPEEWARVPLPLRPTPDVPEWVDMEVDK